MRGQNSRALFAYPVGCIISFQLHFRFELIKKCNFRLVVFSIECCPSRGPVELQSERVKLSPAEASRVESSRASPQSWHDFSPQVALKSRCPSLYMMYIYRRVEFALLALLKIGTLTHAASCGQLSSNRNWNVNGNGREKEGVGTVNCELATGSAADPFML